LQTLRAVGSDRRTLVVMVRWVTLLSIGLCACGRIGFGVVGGDGDGDGGDGGSGDGSGDTGGWTIVTPGPSTPADLYAVWAFAPDNVWVGGFGGAAFQFDGTTWAAHPASMTNISALWGVSPTDLWRVGPLCALEHWNGSSWMPDSVPGCTTAGYLALAGLSATDVWIAGNGGTIEHLVGMTWTALPQSNNINLTSVFAISASDVYFVGSRGSILHWTGPVTDESIGGTTVVASVWAASATDVWAVGSMGSIWHKLGGGSWTAVPSPTTNVLNVVLGTAATDIWAAGAGSTVLHYDGNAWSPVTVPVPANTSLYAIARVTGGGLRMVGSNGVVLAHP
jgi:hypothetical protein